MNGIYCQLIVCIVVVLQYLRTELNRQLSRKGRIHFISVHVDSQ